MIRLSKGEEGCGEGWREGGTQGGRAYLVVAVQDLLLAVLLQGFLHGVDGRLGGAEWL